MVCVALSALVSSMQDGKSPVWGLRKMVSVAGNARRQLPSPLRTRPLQMLQLGKMTSGHSSRSGSSSDSRAAAANLWSMRSEGRQLLLQRKGVSGLMRT